MHQHEGTQKRRNSIFSPGQLFAVREDATADRCGVDIKDRGICLIFERTSGGILMTAQEREPDGAERVSGALFKHAREAAVRRMNSLRKEEARPVAIIVLESSSTGCRLMYRDQIFLFGCAADTPLTAKSVEFVAPIIDDFQRRYGHQRQAPLRRLRDYERHAIRKRAIGVIHTRRLRDGYEDSGYGLLRPFAERVRQLALNLV